MRDHATAALWSEFPTDAGNSFLSTLIDSIPALVAYIDCNMSVQFCNQPFKSWFSLHDEGCGKSFISVLGKQVFDQLQLHMGKVLMGHRANFQISVHTEDGLQFLDATLTPDFNEKRQVKGFIFHSLNVTEKNRTERALKDYFENASIGLHWVNSEGIIIWANAAELNMLGYKEHEYIGHHISEFHTQKDVIGNILHRLSNRETLHNHEANLVCKDGSIRHVSINSTVLWEGDRFVHTRCFTVDVTRQKLAIKALRESEEKFRMIANLVPLVLWTTDDQGQFNFLSVRWEELTGTKPASGLGLQWTSFIHPNDRENVIRSWQNSFSQKRAFEVKFRFRNSKGTYISMYSNSHPTFSSSGAFEGYIGILQDISDEEEIRASLEKMVLDRTDDLRNKNADLRHAETALLQKNEELEKINNQLSSFAHIASHDLQEPLRKIQAFSNQLYHLDGDNFSDKGRQLFERIQHSSYRMKNLIQDLLTYSKSDNNSEEKSEWVDFNSLMREVLVELEVKIADKNAIIEISSLPCLSVIKFQFHQLFLNLLSNALKFSKSGIDPVIKVQSDMIDGIDVPGLIVDKETKYHHFTVSDDGIGFDSKFSDKIFEMFHRLHGRNQYEGTGIGLAICKKIVENHKGAIVAHGLVDGGATFHIYLPAVDK
jgi:PAS domain S-box-containing protein